MNYTIYSTATGEILSKVVCPASEIQMQLRDGQACAEGWHDGNSFYFPGGQLTPLPPRPSEFHKFDFAAGQWALDTAEAWAIIRRRRDALLAETDWMVLRSADGGPVVPEVWRIYRQALRDITLQPDPSAIIWPAPPA